MTAFDGWDAVPEAFIHSWGYQTPRSPTPHSKAVVRVTFMGWDATWAVCGILQLPVDGRVVHSLVIREYDIVMGCEVITADGVRIVDTVLRIGMTSNTFDYR